MAALASSCYCRCAMKSFFFVSIKTGPHNSRAPNLKGMAPRLGSKMKFLQN